MVYDTYSELVFGDYKPTYNWGGGGTLYSTIYWNNLYQPALKSLNTAHKTHPQRQAAVT